MRKGIIYKITSPSNKIYIGQSINWASRLIKYKNLLCKSQIKLYNSFVKYGFDSHKIEILETCNANELNKKERFYQEIYSCVELGLNCLYTKTNKKHQKVSKETRLKMSQARIGKKLSKETKEKMSLARKNYVWTEESREKMRNRNISKETKQRLSNSQWKSKLIIDTNTGVFYYSVRELADIANIKFTTLGAKLRGQNKNNTQYKYV